MSLRKYAYGPPSLTEALDVSNIHTVRDLVRRMRHHRTSAPTDAIYKRDLLRCVNTRFRGLHLDLAKMVSDRVIVCGGEYPDQWIACVADARADRAHSTASKSSAASAREAPRHSAPANSAPHAPLALSR